MHERICADGQKLGALTAAMSERGRQILEAAGLTGLNLPGLRDEMCTSCACRPGTVPNGCLQTQLDLLKTVVEVRRFLCHAPKDGRMCAGAIRVRAAYVERPLPSIQALVADWDYSPPDEEVEQQQEQGKC